MAKTVETLTVSELEIVQQFVDMFELSAEEALKIAISEGAILENEGSGLKFSPDGFEPLRLYIVNNKSHYYKINKALKKDKKEEMFPEENFFYNTKIVKDDKGEYELDKCSTTCLGETVKIIPLRIMYKGRRASFDAQGKPDDTNLETTLAQTIGFLDQETMLSTGYKKGVSVKTLRDNLKKEYGDSVPDNLKIRFRCVLFGLVQVDGKWEKFYLDIANKYEEAALDFEFNKDTTGKIMKFKFTTELKVTGTDDNENPIIQMVNTKELSEKEFLALKPEILAGKKEIETFVHSQIDSVKKEKTEETKPAKETVENSDKDPFEDDY